MVRLCEKYMKASWSGLDLDERFCDEFDNLIEYMALKNSEEAEMIAKKLFPILYKENREERREITFALMDLNSKAAVSPTLARFFVMELLKLHKFGVEIHSFSYMSLIGTLTIYSTNNSLTRDTLFILATDEWFDHISYDLQKNMFKIVFFEPDKAIEEQAMWE